MKRTTILVLFVMITISLIAQETVTLNFTATNQNGSYHSFDVVNVTNVTRGWTESLMYPDTTLVLTSYDGLQENFNNDCLSEVYPNPLSGTAYVTFWMQKTGVINVRVININGRVLSDVTDIIDEGPYQLIINISEPQTAILVIQTSDNQYVKKILNVGYGTCDNISINKVTNTLRGARLRDVGEFKIGDIMSYIAVAFEGSAMIESNRITHAQYDDENIVLTFQATNPSVSTTDVTDITDNTAISGGIVASNGGGTVSARGVCWSTSPNPTLSDSHTADGGGTGSYASNITGLTEYTTYYVRAYATNEVGTEYGEQKTFTTEHTIVVPVVTTNDVTDITSNSAVSGGNVTSSGYGTVSARGICWSASQNPTINDSHTMDGNGIGNFTSTMAGLNEYTTYYVRAYATNEAGTVYGEQKTFTTEHAVVLPTVTTNDVTNITQTTALSGGNVTSSGYGTVSARGVCWSTAHNPTVSGNHTTDGTGTGTFTSNITELTGNTTYYARAYATNESGTAYGNEMSFITTPIGAINGLFTINDNGDQVYFSQGNLQYIGSAAEPYWKFANKQWDYLGDNGQGSTSQNVDRDLFGWGASGYSHGANCYQPWSTSMSNYDYYAYGSSTSDLNDSDGKADWGYNPILNGGNQENCGWRTLTHFEWAYLLNERSTMSGIRFVKATVNDVCGVVVLPDDWNSAYYELDSINSGNYTSNIINLTEWSNALELNGAIFLPAAYIRGGTSVLTSLVTGNYWSASYIDNEHAHGLNFGSYDIHPDDYLDYFRYTGASVRLVRDYNELEK